MTAYRIFRGGATVPLRGHRSYSGFGRPVSIDNQDEWRRQKRCYDLYAGCERAPLGWERR